MGRELNRDWNEFKRVDIIHTTYKFGEYYKLSVFMKDNIITVYLDDVFIMNYTDTIYWFKRSGVGLRSFYASTIATSLYINGKQYILPTESPTTSPTPGLYPLIGVYIQKQNGNNSTITNI